MSENERNHARVLEQLHEDMISRTVDRVRPTKLALSYEVKLELSQLENLAWETARNERIEARARIFEHTLRHRCRQLVATTEVADIDLHMFRKTDVDRCYTIFDNEADNMCTANRDEARAAMLQYFDSSSSEED